MATRQLPPVRRAQAIRTCVGCGCRVAKSELLRLVAAGGEIVPDAPARMPGRGAYLHASQECFDKAQRRRAFPRALRVPGPLGTGRLAGYLETPGPDRARQDQQPGQNARTASTPGKAG
ncbi:MAG TPA: YlxR family protein [Streptosporangiaceae bacterium]